MLELSVFSSSEQSVLSAKIYIYINNTSATTYEIKSKDALPSHRKH